MIEAILFFVYGAIVLAFGLTLTGAFAGVRHTKRNVLIFLRLYCFSGILQLISAVLFSERVVWMLYPHLVHLPLILLLCFVYHKTLATAMTATFTAYLFCQPAKWVGVIVHHFTNSRIAESTARILCLIPIGFVAVVYLSGRLSEIFNKDRRSVYIFGLVPTVYYFFDYITAVYTDLFFKYSQVVVEFLPFLLLVAYLIFCFVYYKEYEQKSEAQRKEQIVRIAVGQQAKEITAVKKMEQEIRMLRHDMRMFLSTLAVSIENGDLNTAREMIGTYTTRIDGTKLQRFCANDVVNYVLSDYAARCEENSIAFCCTVKLAELTVDEVMFASILSNALDNALNAQKQFPSGKRSIKLMLKNSDGKLLLSVKNPLDQPVLFSEGLPVSGKKGHGYGTQSIRYMAERLGGNCQFLAQDGQFVVRVIL